MSKSIPMMSFILYSKNTACDIESSVYPIMLFLLPTPLSEERKCDAKNVNPTSVASWQARLLPAMEGF